MIVLNKPIGRNKKSVNTSAAALETGMYITRFGRSAVKEFLDANNLARCRMLMPAYVCGSFVNHLKQIGVEIHYFNVSNLQGIEISDLKAKILECNPNVVLLIHFFGLRTKNIAATRSFLNSQNLLTLEDYCHSFGSLWTDVKNNVGPQHAIFSFRKTLPLRFGGGYFNATTSALSHQLDSTDDEVETVNPLGLYLVERTAKFLSWPNIYSKRVQWARDTLMNLAGSNSVLVDKKIKFDTDALKFISGNYLFNSSQKRTHNYNYLFKRLSRSSRFRVAMSFNIPQAFIISDKTHLLCDYLNKRGIGAYKWPGDDIADQHLLDEEFPDATRLRSEVTCVPIHQELQEGELLFMAKEINRYYAGL